MKGLVLEENSLGRETQKHKTKQKTQKTNKKNKKTKKTQNTKQKKTTHTHTHTQKKKKNWNQMSWQGSNFHGKKIVKLLFWALALVHSPVPSDEGPMPDSLSLYMEIWTLNNLLDTKFSCFIVVVWQLKSRPLTYQVPVQHHHERNLDNSSWVWLKIHSTFFLC